MLLFAHHLCKGVSIDISDSTLNGMILYDIEAVYSGRYMLFIQMSLGMTRIFEFRSTNHFNQSKFHERSFDILRGEREHTIEQQKPHHHQGF